jgi:hypothetical protein
MEPWLLRGTFPMSSFLMNAPAFLEEPVDAKDRLYSGLSRGIGFPRLFF